MKNSLGLIEIKGLATAILVADTMVKTADVTIVQIEKARGNGWITVKVTGDVGAVNAAVSAGKQIGIANNHYITSKVIPRPANSIETVFCSPIAEAKKNIDTKASEPEEKSIDLVEKNTASETAAVKTEPEEKTQPGDENVIQETCEAEEEPDNTSLVEESVNLKIASVKNKLLADKKTSSSKRKNTSGNTNTNTNRNKKPKTENPKIN